MGGEFHSRVPPSEPLTTKGHAPGVKVGNDAAPSFSAETLPAGSAPSDRTFKPNTQNEIPGQAMNPNISKETWTSADSTLGGATSKDVHQGLGQPMPQGRKELHHGGSEPGKRERTGVAGRGGEADVDGWGGVEGKGNVFGQDGNVMDDLQGMYTMLYRISE